MPQYISKDGVWHVAKEKVALVNHSDKAREINGKMVGAGEPFIYEGPDRASLYELFKLKVDTLGIDFRKDPDLIGRVRQLGYKSVDAYAKDMGYDAEKVEKEFAEKASVVSMHELPAKVEEIDTLGGGRDFSGQGNDMKGGFGVPKDLER